MSTAGGTAVTPSSPDASVEATPSVVGVASKTTPPDGAGGSTPTAGGVKSIVHDTPIVGGGVSDDLGKEAKSSNESKGIVPEQSPTGSKGQALTKQKTSSEGKGGALKVRQGSRVASKTPPPTSEPNVSESSDMSSGSGLVASGATQPEVADRDTSSIITKGACPIDLEESKLEDLQLNLPDGIVEADGKDGLVQRQEADGSLAECALLAKSSLRGYGLRDKVLVHVVQGDCGEEIVRIVVPKPDRLRLIKMARDYGGHLGRKCEISLIACLRGLG